MHKEDAYLSISVADIAINADFGWFNTVSNLKWSAKPQIPFEKTGYLIPTI